MRLHSLITASRRFAKSQIPRGTILEGFELRPPELNLLFLIDKGRLGKIGAEQDQGPCASPPAAPIGARPAAPIGAQPAAPCGAQPSALASLMGVTAGNVTQIINALETRGLIERSVDPNDRRKVMISLTAEGRAAVVKAGGAYRDAYSGLLSELGPDRTDEFIALLDRAASYFNDKFGPVKPMHD